MQRFIAFLTVYLTALGVTLIAVDPAEANPGFARKYNVGCPMCHVAFPKLNDFGRTFAGNGYQFPGEDPAKTGVQLGDELLNLPTSPNFALRVDGFLRWRNDGPAKTDFESPLILKLFSTGYLAKDITYYFYFLASEGGEVVGPEDAFLFFNNIVGDRDWDLMLGQFQVMDTFYPREQRLTFQDLSIYTTNVVETATPGEPGFSLTYDRGAISTFAAGPLFAMVGVTNGNGLGRMEDGHFDNNSYKNQIARLAVDTSGVALGVFGYHGKDQSALTGQSNRFTRFGPDLEISLGRRADLRANWLIGRDEHPTFTAGDEPVSHQGGFAEIDVHFTPRWAGVLLYNHVSSKDLAPLDRRTLTANVTYYKMRNVKFLAEYTHDLHGTEPAHPTKTHTGLLGAVLAY